MINSLSKARLVRNTRVLLALLVAVSMVLVACKPLEEAAEKYEHEILATGDVGTNEYAASPPGQSTILEREYPGAPPLIPHSISELVITKERNSCLTCHVEGLSFGPGHTATKIPESHYIDLPTGILSQNLQGMRYNCLQCHVPQSPEKPLLE